VVSAELEPLSGTWLLITSRRGSTARMDLRHRGHLGSPASSNVLQQCMQKTLQPHGAKAALTKYSKHRMHTRSGGVSSMTSICGGMRSGMRGIGSEALAADDDDEDCERDRRRRRRRL